MVAALPLLRSFGPYVAIALLAVACWGLWERADRIAAERDRIAADLDEAVTINQENVRDHQFEVERLKSDIDAVDAACERRVRIARESASAIECLRRAPVHDSESDVSPVLRGAFDSLQRAD